MSRIVRASWIQANQEVFTSGYAGVQCCAMVLANIVRASILPPCKWFINTPYENMIEGDGMYERIRYLSANDTSAYPVDQSGYIEVRNFDVIKRDFIMYNKSFSIEYEDETSFYGWFAGYC